MPVGLELGVRVLLVDDGREATQVRGHRIEPLSQSIRFLKTPYILPVPLLLTPWQTVALGRGELLNPIHDR